MVMACRILRVPIKSFLRLNTDRPATKHVDDKIMHSKIIDDPFSPDYDRLLLISHVQSLAVMRRLSRKKERERWSMVDGDRKARMRKGGQKYSMKFGTPKQPTYARTHGLLLASRRDQEKLTHVVVSRRTKAEEIMRKDSQIFNLCSIVFCIYFWQDK